MFPSLALIERFREAKRPRTAPSPPLFEVDRALSTPSTSTTTATTPPIDRPPFRHSSLASAQKADAGCFLISLLHFSFQDRTRGPAVSKLQDGPFPGLDPTSKPKLPPEHFSGGGPIILDESYASPESAALHEVGYEGALVAQADSPRDLIPMSAYGKPQPPSQIHVIWPVISICPGLPECTSDDINGISTQSTAASVFL
ncbi:hypothetical protein DH86_00003181 [Scytalidium sp. 3C]|nr:hypothetical protein DH86_00003181 [Scytalidium sp. 3C]